MYGHLILTKHAYHKIQIYCNVEVEHSHCLTKMRSQVFNCQLLRGFATKGVKKLRAGQRQYNTGLVPNAVHGSTTEMLSFIPEYENGLALIKARKWGKAEQEIERTIAVCSNAMGQTSPQVIYLNRLMLNLCFAARNTVDTTSPYAESLARSTIASAVGDVDATIDALRLGRFFLQAGRLENVRELEEHLRESTEGQVCLASAYLAGREFSEGMYILEGLPSSPVVLSNMAGGILLEGGQDAPKTALEFLNAAVEHVEENTDPLLKAHVRCNAGVVCLVAREPEEAIGHLKIAMESIAAGEETTVHPGEGTDGLAVAKGRILAQMGAYYHVTEQAVSAEGMHRAAAEVFEEHSHPSPRRDMVYSRALDLHGSLLKDWDSRESDSEKIFQKAMDLRERLTDRVVPDEILWLDDAWGNLVSK
eukprot:g7994.t1